MCKFDVALEGDLVVIHPQGDFMDGGRFEFEEEMMLNVRKALYPQNVVINMDRVDFIDSSGAACLLKMSRTVKANSGFFAIYSLKSNPMFTLSRLSLDEILTVCKGPEECFSMLLEANEHKLGRLPNTCIA